MPKSKPDLSALKERWPSAYIARGAVKEFTGGAISGGTCANLDSQGKGPPGRVVINGKTCYLLDQFVKWLEERSSSKVSKPVCSPCKCS